MTALEYLLSLHESCQFQTREGSKVGKASKSEMRRWLRNGVLKVNWEKMTESTAIDFPIVSVTLFSKQNTITIL